MKKKSVTKFEVTNDEDVNQISSKVDENIDGVNPASIDYEVAKEAQMQEKLQRRINKSEKAKYLRKKNSEFLNDVREELEICFLQTLNCGPQLNKLWK